MSQIITSCNDSEHGAALGSLNGVSQLQRTPFASKIIAFVDPDKAGIYDNRIGNALASSATDSHLAGGVGSVSSGSIKGIYDQWCEHLSEIAEFLNEGIESAKSWRWIENESGEQDWRALDVERTYFSLAA